MDPYVAENGQANASSLCDLLTAVDINDKIPAETNKEYCVKECEKVQVKKVQVKKAQQSVVNGPTSSRLMKPSQSHHTSIRNLYTGPKLFAKPTAKTNLILIQNAILKALEGAANAKTLRKMQETINIHSKTCGHFLILFRSRGQFKGLYEYDDKQNTITKLDGTGPKSINNEDILKYYKFDSPKRIFTEVQTRHISLTIIAFTIQDHLWSKSLSSRVSSHDLVHHQQQQSPNHHPQAHP